MNTTTATTPFRRAVLRGAVLRGAVLLLAVAGSAAAQDWPAFRGPHGDGRAAPQSAPVRWSATENIKWRTPLPRPANGSPIVAGDRVFLTGPEDAGGRKRSLYCLDRGTGKLLWTRTVGHDKVMPTHSTNPYGATTPATDGTRVVVWHASAGLHCYDFTGEELWQRDFGEFRHPWGYGTSPVIADGKVILHTGPGRTVFVTMLDLADGKMLWRTDEPVPGNGQKTAEGRLLGSWCTPLVTKIDGATQILCTQASRLVSYHPRTGAILWTCSGLSCQKGDLAYSSPCVSGDVCVILGGFEGPEIGIRLAQNRGDVTGTHRIWRHPSRPSNCGSGVAAGGHVYIPDMRGMIVCLDPATGKRLWSDRAVKGAVWSSIILADGKLYAMNQRGATTVFRPNAKKLDVIATNELNEPTNSTPAFAGGEIFLRTHEHIYCVASPADTPARAATPKTTPRQPPRQRGA